MFKENFQRFPQSSRERKKIKLKKHTHTARLYRGFLRSAAIKITGTVCVDAEFSRSAEKHQRTFSMSNLQANGLQQQETTSGFTPVRNLSCSRRTLANAGQVRTGKMQSGLMDIDFCRGSEMVGSEFSVNSMNTLTQSTFCHRAGLLVWGMFS